MAVEDHERLLQTLTQIEGKFLLSGYRNDLYDEYVAANGWRRHELVIDNKAAAGKKKQRKVECLWANFERS